MPRLSLLRVQSFTSEESSQLAQGIGAVAIASAGTDELLRWVLMSLYRSRAAIPVVEGQSTSWLRWAVKAGVDETDDLCGTSEMLRVFKSRIDAVGPLAENRNWIIHGTWRQTALPLNGQVGPRPFGNDEEDGTPVLICFKSRLKGSMAQKAFSIGDVGRIADEYHALNLAITLEWKEIRPPMPHDWYMESAD